MKNHTTHRTILLFLLSLLVLSGCVDLESEAARTVEQSLQALADQNANLVSNLTCQEWEADAIMEVYSFNLVKATLEDVRCSTLGKEAGEYTVQCTGAIVTTYNNETSRIALDQRTYIVREESGDLFVCGYR